MPRLLHTLARALVASLCCATPAWAGTVWLCGLSDDLTRIVCVADSATPTEDAAAPATPVGTVNGTRFPLDPRRQWVVDMWSPATEPESITLLARATLCWRSPDCEVVMNTAMLETRTAAGLSRHRPQVAGR